MKYSPYFQDVLGYADSREVFHYLLKTLNQSITYWDYFVNWAKVSANVKRLEMDLNTLNYLVGKEDVEAEFRLLLEQHPSTIQTLPVLLATREANFKILTDFAGGELVYEDFSFKPKNNLTPEEIEAACRFARQTGLLELFRQKTLKSIPDYVFGIEVGLDSNGRKNRGGTAMEKVVESLLQPICQEHGFGLMEQATAEKIKVAWGLTVRVDKSSRRFDFAVRREETLFLVETNYYSGGGSKLKSTAGEYRALYDFLSIDGHKLIWITDGLGWLTTHRPLEETFNHINYLLNLKMVTLGVLTDILLGKI